MEWMVSPREHRSPFTHHGGFVVSLEPDVYLGQLGMGHSAECGSRGQQPGPGGASVGAQVRYRGKENPAQGRNLRSFGA